MIVDWLSVPAGIKYPKFTDEDRTYIDKWSKKIEPLVSRDAQRRPYYATKHTTTTKVIFGICKKVISQMI